MLACELGFGTTPSFKRHDLANPATGDSDEREYHGLWSANKQSLVKSELRRWTLKVESFEDVPVYLLAKTLHATY